MIVMDHAPYAPFLEARTTHPPGLGPLEPGAWTVVLSDFEPQMRYRSELIEEKQNIVLADTAPDVTAELLSQLLDHLASVPGYTVSDRLVVRPDGVEVSLSETDPLVVIGHLVAEDFCLLLPDEASGEYRLVGAVLCFPSRWLLSEKLGKPLTEIHDPVPDYDEMLARRVNRVFETLRADRPLVRINWLVHAVPELHLPMGHSDKLFQTANPDGPYYLRTERQTLVRLPETGAVAFGIKTSVVPVEKLTPPEAHALARALEGLDAAAMDYRAGPKVIASAVAVLDAIACA